MLTKLTLLLVLFYTSLAPSLSLADALLVPRGSNWRFFAGDFYPSPLWKELAYSDTNWSEGPATLGYGESFIVTTVPYGPSPSNKYTATCFRLSFELSVDPTALAGLSLAANYDDGFVAYLNGFEIARRAMPAGPVEYGTFASSHESGVYESIDVSNHIDLLIPGTNVLAVEVHQTSPSSSDLVWDGELSATGSVAFVWSGAITPTTARVKGRIRQDGAVCRLAVSENPGLNVPEFSDEDTASLEDNNGIVEFTVGDLLENTEYYYAIEVSGTIDTLTIGRFHTWPCGEATFTFAFASCARTGSDHAVFETIRDVNPLFFLHAGDFHYENIGVNDPALFRDAFETVLSSPGQRALYQDNPVDYIWDDHDYGPNNSDSTSPSRPAARQTFQEYVPHYPLAAGIGDVPLYHAFSVGRVRFIVCDSRSARSPAGSPDNVDKTMLGTQQKAWLKKELLNADSTHALTVWVNSLPWIGTTGDDGWHLYTNERRELAEFIADNNIDNLCMLSGDAHMLAIDDGSNSDYSTTGKAAFPVFHAAALDQSGSVKGGPYSHGSYPGGGQFGLVTVTDNGGSIQVDWNGRNHLNQEIVSHSFIRSTSSCQCPSQGDVAPIASLGDGRINLLDVVVLIEYVFRGGTSLPHDASCIYSRGNFNCDDSIDLLDIVAAIDHAFREGPPPCNPCDCKP